MPLFLVKRTQPIPDGEDIDAAMFRGLICQQAFPGLKWLRSYYTHGMGESYCVYDAVDARQVERYSLAAGIPWDAILEVGEITREHYVAEKQMSEAPSVRELADVA